MYAFYADVGCAVIGTHMKKETRLLTKTGLNEQNFKYMNDCKLRVSNFNNIGTPWQIC